MFDELGIARVVQDRGESLSEAEIVIELAEEQQAAIAREASVAVLEMDGRARKEVDGLWPSSLYTRG